MDAEWIKTAAAQVRTTIRQTTIRVDRIGDSRAERLVDEALTHEQVEIERMPIGRMVDAMPPIWEEGDTTILPVVEKVVVVERRLVLKEEVRIRRLRSRERHQRAVTLRAQDAAITRTEAGSRSAGDVRQPLGTERNLIEEANP